uniref:Uncharacterized protein n=1 Tax=Setaria digitata TaxID=48799 RepID=A0A915PVE5_9BILA
MGLFESKSTSVKNHVQQKAKERKSERSQLKALNMDVKQTGNQSLSHSVRDLEKKQTISWITSQELKRSRDLMKISKAKLDIKKNELSQCEKHEKSASMRRQRDKSLKKELSRRLENSNQREVPTSLKRPSMVKSLRVETSKRKEPVIQNRSVRKDNDEKLDRTQEQRTEETRS